MMTSDEIDGILYRGTYSACDALLQNWSDDNDTNRERVESLLADAMLRVATL